MDIIVWNNVLNRAFELFSMEIRVGKDALLKQLKMRNAEERKKLLWHSMLLDGKMQVSIGGGIGQSLLCMYFLRKAHIGEIQASIWPSKMKNESEKAGIHLL